ncbi:MAG: hypothetical protein JO218_07165 [Burkholderiales bacterium]|nr:hypothetical protein [Burkholderiales bacterium]
MKHVMQKLGVSVGLMATSAAAFASGSSLSLHTFGDPMVYARGGTTPLYTAFIPSGNQTTDGVILLELTQGTGTAPGTWQYYISNGGLTTASGGLYNLNFTTAATPTDIKMTVWSISNTVSDSKAAGAPMLFGGTSALTYYGPVGNNSSAGSSISIGTFSSNFGEIMMPFSYSTAVSSASATCNVSFNAYVGSDDYMHYHIAGVQLKTGIQPGLDAVLAAAASNSASYSFTTKSGGAASDTISAAAAGAASGTVTGGGFGGLFGQSYGTGTSYAVPAYTYLSGSIDGAATSFGSAALKEYAACATLANNRLANNASPFTVGGKQGLLRLW